MLPHMRACVEGKKSHNKPKCIWIGEDKGFQKPSRAVRMCVKSKAFRDPLFYSMSSGGVLKKKKKKKGKRREKKKNSSRSPTQPPISHTHTRTKPSLPHTPYVLFSGLWEGCIRLWRGLLKSCSRPDLFLGLQGLIQWKRVRAQGNTGLWESRWAGSAPLLCEV